MVEALAKRNLKLKDGFHPLTGKRFEKGGDFPQHGRVMHRVSIPLQGKGLRKNRMVYLPPKNSSRSFHPLTGKRFEKEESGFLVSRWHLRGFHPLTGKRFEKARRNTKSRPGTILVSIPLRGKGLRKPSFLVSKKLRYPILFPSPCGEKV